MSDGVYEASDCFCSPEDVAEGLPEPVLARVQREAGMPFDLAAGPLVRTLLVQLAPEDCLLLLVMHHSVSDGWSFKVCGSAVNICCCTLMPKRGCHAPCFTAPAAHSSSV